ncbi:NAD(P)-dependent oxidoreductase [Streptomyces sp. NPDC102270]|uniref:NAD(P)-dependent oxidoreductase n=1 Tax=Streptomyces sp. NPDC102270 TaxID=3366150 RepID=UPI0038276225
MRVQHHHPRRREDDELSVHTPLTKEAKGVIGTAELARMKPTATLVNTGRGGVVDEEALLTALCRGDLHSAGLGVMTGEPRTDPSDPLLNEPRGSPRWQSPHGQHHQVRGGPRRTHHRSSAGRRPRTHPPPPNTRPARPAGPAGGVAGAPRARRAPPHGGHHHCHARVPGRHAARARTATHTPAARERTVGPPGGSRTCCDPATASRKPA